MRIEDKVREHLEAKASRYPTPGIDLADVIERGDRLRWRARGATLVMSVAATAAVAVVGVAMVGSGRADPDAATLLSEQPLFAQVLEAWTPVPDPVDPELAASAVELCPPPAGDIPGVAVMPAGLPLLLIDQRGIIADAYFGAEVDEGEFLAYNCPLIKIDGVWQSSLSVTTDLPQMRGASGGPLGAEVAEVRIRFADGNEVVASIGNSNYYVRYPMSFDNAGSYIDHYRSDGSLISSEPYFLPDDLSQASTVFEDGYALTPVETTSLLVECLQDRGLDITQSANAIEYDNRVVADADFEIGVAACETELRDAGFLLPGDNPDNIQVLYAQYEALAECYRKAGIQVSDAPTLDDFIDALQAGIPTWSPQAEAIRHSGINATNQAEHNCAIPTPQQVQSRN